MRIIKAESLDQAINLLNDGFSVLAGGTNVFVDKKKGVLKNENFVDITGLDLNYIKEDESGFYIGALTTFDSIERYFKKKKGYNEIYLSAFNMGGPQIRNRATLIGNIADCSPAADGAPFLLVNEAIITAVSVNGERKINIKDFFVSFRKTALNKNEIITSVFIKKQEGEGSFIKVGLRNAMAISVASIAVKKVDGKIKIAVGSLSPTPKRLCNLENYVNSAEKLDQADIEKQLTKDISPITDLRASAEYRKKVCYNVVISYLKEIGYEF